MLRAFATVGGLNLVSRILGFVRDILIARLIGAGPIADAFFVALRYPNLFRSLFAEGAFNAAFVPMFAGRLQESGLEAARRFAEQVLAVLLSVLLAFTALAQLAMPWLIYAIAPGFSEEPAKLELAVLFTQITFPYLLFMSLTALHGGILNSLHRFAHAAAAPMILNIVLIVALALVVPLTGMPGHVLSWGVAVAGLAQFLWLVHGCRRAGIALRVPVPRLTPPVRRLLRLMIPGVIGAGAMQLNLLIGTIVASLQSSAVSYLYYADRLYQLPLAVVGTAAGIVLLPSLARSLKAGRHDVAAHTLSRGIEFTMFLIFPATAALIAMPAPIVAVLFERGAFGPAETSATAWAVLAYATGLPAYVLVKVLAPCFFAREDTRTPFFFAVIAMAANALLSLGLFFLIGHVGIALSTALASWLNVALLALTLHRRGHLEFDPQLRRRLPRLFAAGAAMGLVLWLVAPAFDRWLAASLLLQVLALVLLVLGGAALYGVLAVLSRGASLADIRQAMRRQPAPPT
jgi:putative peptidoglycan lipid II flippase